jgi:hypothetical protein
VKKRFDSTTKNTAQTRSPGPAPASAAVVSTQPPVDSSSSRFFTSRLETASALLQRSVAQSCPSAMLPTK